MPTPTGRWATLNPNPYLDPYPNFTPLIPETGEVGFAIYYCAPAPTAFSAGLITLAFTKPSGAILIVAPFLSRVPNTLYLPGMPAWCYLTNGDLNEGGTYAVHLEQNFHRITNDAPLFVFGPTLPAPPPPPLP